MRGGAKCWLPWMRGQVDEGGSDDCFAGEPGCGIVDVVFDGGSLGPNGWFTKNMKDGKLIGITVFYGTADPAATGYYEALYRCHWLGDFSGPVRLHDRYVSPDKTRRWLRKYSA